MGGERIRSPSRVSSTPTIAFSPSAADMPRAMSHPPALGLTVAPPGPEPEPEGDGCADASVVVVESQEPASPHGYHEDDADSKLGSWCIPSETLTSVSGPSCVSSSSAVADFGQKLDQSIAVQMEILKELKEVKVELQRKRQRSPEGAL